MSSRDKLAVLALAAALGALVLPAFAQNDPGSMQPMPDHGIGMGRIGQGMSGAMMSGAMMGGGCDEMMQSMNNSGAPPNGQWRKGTRRGAAPN
jgi:hypothetical protein